MPENNGSYPVSLETVKQYLRVDFPDDDALFGIMMDTAKQYIRDGIGAFEPENPRPVKRRFLRIGFLRAVCLRFRPGRDKYGVGICRVILGILPGYGSAEYRYPLVEILNPYLLHS